MADRVDNSPELAVIEDRQALCMAEAGFAEFRSSKDVLRAQRANQNRYRDGSLTYEEAIENDRELALPWFDCYELVAPDIRKLTDAAAAAFVESNQLVLDG